MALFGIFGKKQPVEKTQEIDELKELRKEEAKIRAQHQREKMRLDLEKMRLDAQREKAELEDQLQEQRLERQIRSMERQVRMRDLQEELFGDEEDDDPQGDSPESMLFGLMNNIIKKNNSQSPATPYTGNVPMFANENSPTAQPVTLNSSSAVEEQPKGVITYDAILQRWNTLPATYKAMAKNMTDDQLKAYLINEMPEATPQVLEMAIQVVRRN